MGSWPVRSSTPSSSGISHYNLSTVIGSLRSRSPLNDGQKASVVNERRYREERNRQSLRNVWLHNKKPLINKQVPEAKVWIQQCQSSVCPAVCFIQPSFSLIPPLHVSKLGRLWRFTASLNVRAVPRTDYTNLIFQNTASRKDAAGARERTTCVWTETRREDVQWESAFVWMLFGSSSYSNLHMCSSQLCSLYHLWTVSSCRRSPAGWFSSHGAEMCRPPGKVD